MSGATCPACGVPVVPGYIKCPKCHAVLPRIVFRRAGTTNASGGVAASGTSLGGFAGGGGSVPVPAIAGGAAVLLLAIVIAWLALRHGGSAKADSGPGSAAALIAVAPTQAQPQAQAPVQAEAPSAPSQAVAPRGPSTQEVGLELKRALDRQRLWSDISVGGGALEVRSSACNDPAMGPALDAEMPRAKAAGLTQLRCVSQSGGVISTRAL